MLGHNILKRDTFTLKYQLRPLRPSLEQARASRVGASGVSGVSVGSTELNSPSTYSKVLLC